MNVPKVVINSDEISSKMVTIDGMPLDIPLRRLEYVHDANSESQLPVLKLEVVGCEFAVNASVRPEFSDDLIWAVCFYEEKKVRDCLAKMDEDSSKYPMPTV